MSTIANGKPSKPSRTDLSVFFEETLYPALFDRLESAFPEFEFERRGDAKVARRFPPTIPLRVNNQSPDRLVAYSNTPFGFLVHGHSLVRWLAYLNRGVTPKGEDFIRLARELSQRAGPPHYELLTASRFPAISGGSRRIAPCRPCPSRPSSRTCLTRAGTRRTSAIG